MQAGSGLARFRLLNLGTFTKDLKRFCRGFGLAQKVALPIDCFGGAWARRGKNSDKEYRGYPSLSCNTR